MVARCVLCAAMRRCAFRGMLPALRSSGNNAVRADHDLVDHRFTVGKDACSSARSGVSGCIAPRPYRGRFRAVQTAPCASCRRSLPSVPASWFGTRNVIPVRIVSATALFFNLPSSWAGNALPGRAEGTDGPPRRRVVIPGASRSLSCARLSRLRSHRMGVRAIDPRDGAAMRLAPRKRLESVDLKHNPIASPSPESPDDCGGPVKILRRNYPSNRLW